MKKGFLIMLLAMSSLSINAQEIPYGNDGIVAPGSNFFVTVTPWPRCTLNYFFSSYTADLTQANQRTAVINAFNTWSAAVNLTFVEVTTAATADIIIGWGTGTHTITNACPTAFAGPGGVLAHAYFPGFAALSGDVHFDDAETWSLTGTGGTFDLQTVALHEIGHALGLDHTTVAGAVMAPSYGGVRRVLTSDDLAGIRSLYPNGIVGAGSVCTGSNVYSFPNTPGNPSYTWTVTSGLSITAGQGTNTVTITPTATATSAQICVTASNGCQSCRNVTIGAPIMPSNITFARIGSSCEYQATCTAVAGATSYQWSQNNFATFWTSTTNVDPNTYTSPQTVTLSVRAVNNCGNSAIKTVTRSLTRPPGCMARIGADQNNTDQNPAAHIFPNPSDGHFTLSVDEFQVGNQLMLLDLSGRVVFETRIQQTVSTFDFSAFESGTYVLRINSADTSFTDRIIIQH